MSWTPRAPWLLLISAAVALGSACDDAPGGFSDYSPTDEAGITDAPDSTPSASATPRDPTESEAPSAAPNPTDAPATATPAPTHAPTPTSAPAPTQSDAPEATPSSAAPTDAPAATAAPTPSTPTPAAEPTDPPEATPPLKCDPQRGGGLKVTVDYAKGYPTAPRFHYERPAGAGDATLYVQDPPFTQSFTQSATDREAGTIVLPLTPSLDTTWRLELTVPGGVCRTEGHLVNGAYPVNTMPLMVSSMTVNSLGRRDFHLIPATIGPPPPAPGAKHAVILLNERGQLLWYWPMLYPILTVQLDPQGRGVWTMPELDTLNNGVNEPPTSLDLWGWDGRMVESYTVPAGHHDFDLSPDGRKVNSLAYVDFEALEQACGYTVYGDYLYEYDLDKRTNTSVWDSTQAGFPLPPAGDCPEVFAGFSYYYANGMERVGDTFSVTFSGGISALMIGAADGAWYMVSDHNDGLTIVNDGDDLREDLVRLPHSLWCAEGADWGMGLPDDAIVCASFARRGVQACDSADLFWVNRQDDTAHYVATWPPASQATPLNPLCTTTATHGNVTVLGSPATTPSEETRLAMYSSNQGILHVMRAQGDAGKLTVSYEYTISPGVPLSVTGEFVTSAHSLGQNHQLVEYR